MGVLRLLSPSHCQSKNTNSEFLYHRENVFHNRSSSSGMPFYSSICRVLKKCTKCNEFRMSKADFATHRLTSHLISWDSSPNCETWSIARSYSRGTVWFLEMRTSRAIFTTNTQILAEFSAPDILPVSSVPTKRYARRYGLYLCTRTGSFALEACWAIGPLTDGRKASAASNTFLRKQWHISQCSLAPLSRLAARSSN